jgi:hypothetical protein
MLTSVAEIPGDANGLCVSTHHGDIYVMDDGYGGDESWNAVAQIHLIKTDIPLPKEKKPVGVNGDPHFTGFHGEKFDVRGEPYQVYNLVSHKGFALNVLFVPGVTQQMVDGAKVLEEGTFMGEAGILVNDGQSTRHIRMALDTDKKDVIIQVLLDGKAVTEADKRVGDVLISVTRKGVFVTTPIWEVAFNAHLSPLDQPMLNLRYIKPRSNPLAGGVAPHGLLGQTLDGDREAVHGAKGRDAQGEGAIEGTHSEYQVSGLFAVDFKYNRYHATSAAVRDTSKLAGERTVASEEAGAGAEN